jgi:hypothetical protein
MIKTLPYRLEMGNGLNMVGLLQFVNLLRKIVGSPDKLRPSLLSPFRKHKPPVPNSITDINIVF